MKGQIEHSGTVESIGGGYIHVRITQSSACAGCTARSLCQSAESKDKIVDVPLGHEYGSGLGYDGCPSVGERVTVYGSSEMGRTAVVLAFVIPLILMVVTIALSIKTVGMSEPAAVGIGLLVLSAYYIVLWTGRKRIQRRFVWRIKRFASEK